MPCPGKEVCRDYMGRGMIVLAMRTGFDRLAAVAAGLTGAALVGYWAWRYEGLYRWLAERQLNWFGSYEVQITFLLALGIVEAPIFATVALVRKLGRTAVKPTGAVASGPSRVAHPVSNRIQLFLGRWGMALMLG